MLNAGLYVENANTGSYQIKTNLGWIMHPEKNPKKQQNILCTKSVNFPSLI